MEEINKLGFNEEDQVVLFADEETVMIKKLFLQEHSMFPTQYRKKQLTSSSYRKPKTSVREVNRFRDKNKFRDFASPIWEEAKKDNLTPKDIDEIIHQVRKAEKN